MFEKRGQAAMEFLMTYGWAILAAVIVVGVLWYLIGNPANLLGTQFSITNPFVKSAVSIQTSGVTMEFRNGLGQQVSITNLNISNCIGTVTPTLPINIADGALQAFTIPCTLISGSRFKGDIVVEYMTEGSTVKQQSTGSVSGKVA